MKTQRISLGRPSTSHNKFRGREHANRQSAKDGDTKNQLRQAQHLNKKLGAEKTQIGSLPRTMTKIFSFGRPSTSKNNFWGRTNANRQSANDDTLRISLGKPSTSKNKFWAETMQ